MMGSILDQLFPGDLDFLMFSSTIHPADLAKVRVGALNIVEPSPHMDGGVMHPSRSGGTGFQYRQTHSHGIHLGSNLNLTL